MSKTKILIASSQGVVRVGLRSLLGDATGFTVVGNTEDTDGTLQLIERNAPEILILDGDDPEFDLVGFLKTVKSSHPRLAILIYSINESEEFFLRIFHAGAHGYLLKTSDPKFLFEAIHRLKDGELFFGPKISELMLKRFLQKSREPDIERPPALNNLTEREIEVLTLIASGKTNNEIADRLFISPHTVHVHRTNLLKKLNAHGTAQLVRFAIEHRIAPPHAQDSDS